MDPSEIVLGIIWAAAFYHVEPQFDWSPCDIPREQKDAALRFLRAYEDADRPCHTPKLPCAVMLNVEQRAQDFEHLHEEG